MYTISIKKSCLIILIPVLTLFFLLLLYMFVCQNLLYEPFPFSIQTTTEAKLGSNIDAVNIIFSENVQKINKIFSQAGWLVPDRTKKQTTKRIIVVSLHNTSFPNAPVSPLSIDKKKEDFPTKSFRERHHVRIWKTSFTYENQQVFFVSDTFDSGIELVPKGCFPTHHVKWNIDQKREFLTSSLLHIRI